MNYLVGLVLALVIGAFARWIRLDRDRAFYSTVTMVIASYYVLFAVMGGSVPTLLLQIGICLGFVALAATGFKRSLWFVVAGLAAHGVFDFTLAQAIEHSGMPEFWPGFCGTYDVTAAAFLAFLLTRSRAAGEAVKQ